MPVDVGKSSDSPAIRVDVLDIRFPVSIQSILGVATASKLRVCEPWGRFLSDDPILQKTMTHLAYLRHRGALKFKPPELDMFCLLMSFPIFIHVDLLR